MEASLELPFDILSPSMDMGSLCMYAGMCNVYMYACMHAFCRAFFGFRILTGAKVTQYGSVVDNVLLRYAVAGKWNSQ